MKPDPPVRPDGLCACGCGKPRHPERSRKYGKAAAEVDPFATTECAKAWHGIPQRSVDAKPRHKFTDPYIAQDGYCACGCGQTTSVAADNNSSKGYVKGEPLKWVQHHNLQPKAPR